MGNSASSSPPPPPATITAVPDLIAAIRTDDGGFVSSAPLLPIDAAHRDAVPHRGVWVYVVLVPAGDLIPMALTATSAIN